MIIFHIDIAIIVFTIPPHDWFGNTSKFITHFIFSGLITVGVPLIAKIRWADFHYVRETNVVALIQELFIQIFLVIQVNNVSFEIFSHMTGNSAAYTPRQVAACRPKCTVSKQTAHLAALMLRPTVKRCGMLWCILSFTRRPNSEIEIQTRKGSWPR